VRGIETTLGSGNAGGSDIGADSMNIRVDSLGARFRESPTPEPGRMIASLPRTPTLGELASLTAFRRLNDIELNRIRSVATVRRAKPGEEFSPWRFEPAMFCVSFNAHFDMTMMAPSGRLCMVGSVGPGEMFGEIAALAAPPRQSAVYISKEGGSYLAIPSSELAGLLLDIPQLCAGLLYNTAALAAAQTERIYELSTLDLRHRLMAELLRLAERGEREGARIVIRRAPTHEALATIISGTREGITRELKSLSAMGIVQIRRREITILNIDLLRAHLTEPSGDLMGSNGARPR
jgi:CRP/FNR family transcriptional regulator, cyclic AMP receptor protein